MGFHPTALISSGGWCVVGCPRMSRETEALPGSRIEQTWVARGHSTATCDQNGNKTKPNEFLCRTLWAPRMPRPQIPALQKCRSGTWISCCRLEASAEGPAGSQPPLVGGVSEVATLRVKEQPGPRGILFLIFICLTMSGLGCSTSTQELWCSGLAASQHVGS